jgi:hypothetical protein
MPHLQLEVTAKYSLALKRDLARRLGDIYALIMQTSPQSRGRQLPRTRRGQFMALRCVGADPSAVLMCDIALADRWSSAHSWLRRCMALVSRR